MSQLALGLIETVGLLAGIEAADAAVKSANVRLIGYEFAKGDGMTTIKVEGDVGAVKAAVSSAVAAASKVGSVYSSHVIPRPALGLEQMIFTKDTVGWSNMKPSAEEDSKAPEVKEMPVAEEVSPAQEVTAEVKATEEVLPEEIDQEASAEEIVSAKEIAEEEIVEEAPVEDTSAEDSSTEENPSGEDSKEPGSAARKKKRGR